jgi:hypothetical protein
MPPMAAPFICPTRHPVALARRSLMAIALALAAALAPTAFAHAAETDPDDLDQRGQALMAQERIGGLRLGLPEQAVLQLVSCPFKRSKETLWDALGDYHQDWNAPACGIKLDMASEKKGQPKKVSMIYVTAPSTWATSRGVKIGSSEAEVRKAYKGLISKESSQAGKSVVAGTVYGGLVFDITQGRVSQMFVGAAAE